MDPALLDFFWFRVLAGLTVGLTLGSFVTMLSYRVPRKLSIVRPPSSCPLCGVALKPRDLIPILSWALNKGRCRACGAPISLRYPLIELSTAGAVTLAFVGLGFTPELLVALLGLIALTTLAVINIERRTGT